MNYNINVAENVNKMLTFAKNSAKIYNLGEVATEHLVFGILCLDDCFATDLLAGYGVDKQDFEQVLAESKQDGDNVYKTPDLTPKSKQVFVRAQNLAKELGNSFVMPEHILFSILMIEAIHFMPILILPF